MRKIFSVARALALVVLRHRLQCPHSTAVPALDARGGQFHLPSNTFCVRKIRRREPQGNQSLPRPEISRTSLAGHSIASWDAEMPGARILKIEARARIRNAHPAYYTMALWVSATPPCILARACVSKDAAERFPPNPDPERTGRPAFQVRLTMGPDDNEN